MGDHSQYWRAPYMLKSSLKNTAATFRKSFDDSNQKNFLQRLKNVMEHFKPILHGRVL